jgi:outer membrane cobalamin receptor
LNAPAAIVVVDRESTPLRNASARSGSLIYPADANGRIVIRAAPPHLRVVVEAPGCTSQTLILTGGSSVERVTLDCTPPLIGSVSVATGSLESRHELPYATSLMDEAQIAASSASTSDALLGMLPGFDRDRSNSAFSNYGLNWVSFAGAGQDRGLVLADDIPAQDGFGGQVDWAQYPALNITRAELFRGAGSALYGAGAIGGVLALTTFGPNADWQAPPSGTVFSSGGSNGEGTLYGAVATPIAPKLTASFASSTYRLSYFDLAPDYSSYNATDAQAQETMASMGLRYTASPGSIFEYDYRAAWDSQYEGRPNYTFWRRVAQNAFRYIHPADRSSVSLYYFFRNNFIINSADQFPTQPGVLLYTQYVPSTDDGVGANWTIDSDNSTFQMRADGLFVRGVSDQYFPDNVLQVAGSGQQDLDGVALQETWRLLRLRPNEKPRLQLVAGARVDSGSFFSGELYGKGPTGVYATTPTPAWTDRAISPRAALRYDLTNNLALRISSGSGILYPYLNQLLRGYRIGSVSYLPNPNLVPERSNSLVSGLDWTNGRSALSYDFTQTFVNDSIMFITINPTTQEYENVAHTQTDGSTLSYTQALGRCTRLSLSGTDQYARVTSAGSDVALLGKRLEYIPDAYATLALDGAIGRVATGVSVSYTGQTYADDLNTEPLGTAVVLGARVAIPLAEGAQLVFEGSNVTDARYLSSIDRLAPPSVVSLGVQVPLQPKPTGNALLTCA